MSDIIHTLPTFNTKPYTHLLHSIEKNDITTADLLTLDPLEIARRCPLPLLEVKRLVKDVIEACQVDAGISTNPIGTSNDLLASSDRGTTRKWHDADQQPHMIRTLDMDIDVALDGGIHTGYLTEISGESAAGKTQFALGLLLSAQLPAPHGLGRSAIYISTEAALNTLRLHQMLASHPFYAALNPKSRPTLDKIHSITVTDLEAQDHILEFQLPLGIQQYNAGLVIIDSVAANYRAEHSTSSSSGLADRATELARLGSLLRRLASEYDVAVVVTNQVADRFDDPAGPAIPTLELLRAGSPNGSPSPGGSTQGKMQTQHLDTTMSLDHQSRFFTGWGNERPCHPNQKEDLKTPALGLAWANQIAARIVLKMEADKRIITTSQAPESNSGGLPFGSSDLNGNIYNERRRRRFMHVVFCPWAAGTEEGVEYEIVRGGIRSVRDETKELLDERLWGLDGVDEEEEYPL